ncbi:MAG: hypothetical protein J4G11_05880 [Acidimicrobiia bacterium]|nr:hypothetical protein [Acidimicrobiia bacterium]
MVTIGDRSLVEPNDIYPESVSDALAIMREFFRDVQSPRDQGVLGWNFWPASGSSIPHPHIQAVASGRLPIDSGRSASARIAIGPSTTRTSGTTSSPSMVGR